MVNHLRHALQVALISVHDNVLGSNVVLVSHLLSKGLNSSLHESLFSINIEHTVAVIGKFSNGGKSSRKCFKYGQVIFIETYTCTNSNALQKVSS
jgi:hypothetical protein